MQRSTQVGEDRTRDACSAVTHSSHVRISVTPRAAALQAPLSVGTCRQEYHRGLPFPSPGDLPDLGVEPGSPAAGRVFTV